LVTEVVLTFVCVLVVLIATSRVGSPGFAGLAIGLALTVVHLIGIPLTGTSVNPARSLGPALIVGDKALSQVWLFIVAPLLGGAFAAVVYRYFVPPEMAAAAVEPSAIAEGVVERTTATPLPAPSLKRPAAPSQTTSRLTRGRSLKATSFLMVRPPLHGLAVGSVHRHAGPPARPSPRATRRSCAAAPQRPLANH